MARYSIEQLSKMAGGQLRRGSTSCNDISYLLYDSRKLSHPSETLFVALRSQRNDGHKYISSLYAHGVRNFLVDTNPNDSNLEEANFLVVKNTLTALQEIAAKHRNEFAFPIVGITGSNGKTIVKEWLYSLVHQDFNIARSPKSFNSQLGTALSLWNLSNEHNLAIIEAGISQPGEMPFLQKMIQPTSGIFTNIGSAHAENFTSQTEKIEEKLALFKHVDRLIYCADHKLIADQIHKNFTGKTFTWGFDQSADLRIAATEDKNVFELTILDQTSNIFLPFGDQASIENSLHCVAWMIAHGYKVSTISERIQKLDAPEMRLQILQGRNNCTIINDAWIVDVDSLLIALQLLSQQPKNLKRTVILSDILESGLNSDLLYNQVAEILNTHQINRLVGVGEIIGEKMKAFKGEKNFFHTTADLINALPILPFQDEAILLKGARIFEFEKAASALQLKTHETVLEINLSNLIHNLNYYKSRLPSSVKMMAMVKAFSYGSGSVEVANVLQFHGADYLAVAYADEGLELRRAGINLPIMVMNPEANSIIPMIENRLEPEIFSFRVLHQFLHALQVRSGFDSDELRIHIKLDTGMHRLGFEEKDLPELIDLLNRNPKIGIASVFSHLAASSELEHDAFTKSQIDKFKHYAAQIEVGTQKKFLKHILNSGGITRHPEAAFDMVRLGIGMYGIGESQEQANLLTVGKLSTMISQIRTIKENESVGYSRKAVMKVTSRIATIPIGYADGFSRKLGHGKFEVNIHGVKAPTVGSICMDMCMIDVTHIPQANEGDQVVIFENSKDIKSFAEALETIPYEVLTNISPRVKRVYFQE